MAKRQERLQAIELRKQGLFFTEIAKQLHVCRNTVIEWCRGIVVPAEQIKDKRRASYLCGMQKRKANTDVKREQWRQEGEQYILHSDDTLLLAGTIMYWAEGGKAQRGSVQLSNSDVKVHQLFIKWVSLLGIQLSHLRYMLHIHEGLDEQSVKMFWRTQLGISDTQFYKTQIKKSSIGHRKHYLYKGTMSVSIADTHTFYFIEGLVRGAQKKLIL